MAAPTASVASVTPAPKLVFGALPVPTGKQQSNKHQKAKQTAIEIRKLHWPEVKDDDLWLLSDRKRGGFAQVPRPLSLVMNIINDITKRKYAKAVPAGKTFLVLWLHHYGEGLVKIDSEADAAYEAGYGGERNISTFRAHMKILQEIGFIDFRAGTKGPMQYVLMRNPYAVVKRLHGEKLVSDQQFAALIERTNAIGSGDELKG